MTIDNLTPEDIYYGRKQIFGALGYLNLPDFMDYVEETLGIEWEQVRQQLIPLIQDKDFIEKYTLQDFISKEAIKFFK